MTTDTGIFETGVHEGGEAWRWGAALALMLGLHAGIIVLLVQHTRLADPLPAVPEAVLLDLAPEPAAAMPEPAPALAPAPTPEPLPRVEPPPVVPPAPIEPAPIQPPPVEPPTVQPLPPEPVPAVLEPPLPPPPVEPEVVLPEPPPPPPPRPVPPRPVPPRPAPPRPVPRPSPRPATQDASPQTAPAEAANPRPAPPAPVQASAAPPSNAVPNWRGEVAGRLARAKRYPDVARSRGEQGVAQATFTVDRNGRVLSAAVSRSSGSRLLDEEAVALIHRAEPLPPMPAEMPGATATLTVPVAFALQ